MAVLSFALFTRESSCVILVSVRAPMHNHMNHHRRHGSKLERGAGSNRGLSRSSQQLLARLHVGLETTAAHAGRCQAHASMRSTGDACWPCR